MECRDEIRDTVLAALRSASEACDELCRFTLEAAGRLRSGEIREGNELLSGIVNDFSQLVGLFVDVTQLEGIGAAGQEKAGADLEEESHATASLMRMAVEAQEKQDWVYLADILEYEFPERLQAWNGLFSGLSGSVQAAPSL
jgi:hypothetical protein